GVLLQPVPQGPQGALPAVPDGDEEVPAGEAHDLAGLHHLAAGGEPVVVEVVDGLEDREEGVVVALQLGPLMGLDGVLHGQRVQPELPGDPREFGLRRLVQADPHEAAVAAHQPHGLLRVQRSLGRQPAAVAVHGAVDHGGHRAVVAGGVVGAALLPQRDTGGTDHGAQVADHRHGGLLRERATKGAGTTGGTSRNEDVLTRIPSRTGGEGCLARPQSGEHRTVVVAGFVADTATGADQAERNEALFRWGRTYERWRTRNRRKTSEGGRAGDTARSTSVHASTTSSGRSLVRDDSPSPWGYPRERGCVT